MRLSNSLNLKTYDNLLLLRLEWHFGKGRSKQRSVKEFNFEREQKAGRGQL